MAVDDIEIAGRLIGKENLGTVDHRARDGKTLLFPTGQLVGEAIGLLAKTDNGQYLRHIALDFIQCGIRNLHRECNILVRSLLCEQFEVLIDRSELAAKIWHVLFFDGIKISVVHNYFARCRTQLARQYPQQRGLACAGKSDERHKLAFLDNQINAVQDDFPGSVYLAYVVEFNHVKAVEL